MKMQLLVVLLLYTCHKSSTAASTPEGNTDTAPMVRSAGCKKQCGNVTIPYPFGMGRPDQNCYYDDWFRIDCKNSKPILTRAKLEVVDISMDRTLQVYIPVASFCDKKNESKPVGVLKDSPFSVSTAPTNKIFKAPVLLAWRINNNTQSYDLYRNFTWDNETSLNGDEVDVGYGLFSGSYDYRPYYYYGMANSGWYDPYCYYNKCSPELNWSIEIVCSCGLGFQGNPYLGKDSCRDIDECKGINRCPKGKCVNDLYGYHCEDDKKRAKLILAAGLSSSFGLLLLLIGAWFGFQFLKKRNEIKRKKMFFKRNGGLLLEQEFSSGKVDVEKIKLFKSEDLQKSTDNFNGDRILGQGSQGTVYKGMLENGRIVAVKKSKMVDESQLSQFINEVVILSQLNHRNIVQLLGCCLETEVPLLVYEFIPNGTLSKYIVDQIEEFPLTWKRRLQIATEIAGALSHLHYTASFPIYHRDIKSTNILLDEKYRAKVADFGTSRSIAIDQTHLTTSLVHGTFGYLDPEYFQSSQFTEKSDVYSFGVVLVELLTGQKPISFLRSEDEGRSLATYFIISMHKDRLFEIVDAQVLQDGPKEDVIAVANLARRCLNLSGRKRPTMREVTTELEAIQKKRKGVEGEQHYEEVEYQRRDSIEPWDITSSSSATVAGPVSTYADIHYYLSSQCKQNIS